MLCAVQNLPHPKIPFTLSAHTPCIVLCSRMIQLKGFRLWILVASLIVRNALAMSYTEQLCPDLPVLPKVHFSTRHPGAMSDDGRLVAVAYITRPETLLERVQLWFTTQRRAFKSDPQ